MVAEEVTWSACGCPLMSHPVQGILVAMSYGCRSSIGRAVWRWAGGDLSHHHRWRDSNYSDGSGEVAEYGGDGSDDYGCAGDDK